MNSQRNEVMKKKNDQLDDRENKTRILVVDDHPVVRQGLTSLINLESDLGVCAQAENAVQALEVIEKEKVDLAIVDISLGGTNGIRHTEQIKSTHPHLPVLILTIHNEDLYAERALQAGAKGYVNKHEAAETIITAIRLILSGKEYYSTTTWEFLKRRHPEGSRTDVTDLEAECHKY